MKGPTQRDEYIKKTMNTFPPHSTLSQVTYIVNVAECGGYVSLYGPKVLPVHYITVWNIVYKYHFLPIQTPATAALIYND